jgi:hypothetical protein
VTRVRQSAHVTPHRPAPHRLPHRGTHRSALRARRGRAHRRHFRIYRAAAARARKEKPKVSAFTSAKIDEILALKPDFVVGFSDIQADIARELVKAGVEVWISNHRSVDGILDYIVRLGALVGAHDAARLRAASARASRRYCSAARIGNAGRASISSNGTIR